MPAYKVQINDKLLKIEIASNHGKAFTAKFEGKTLKVELQDDKPDLTKPFSIEVDGKTYQVEPSETFQEKPFQMKIEEATFKVSVETATVEPAIAAFAPAVVAVSKKNLVQQIAVEGSVTAPMTGKVVSVKVKKGEVVKQGQAVCVIEAMKMENEIVASKAGTVQAVNVSEGSAVKEGETLLVII